MKASNYFLTICIVTYNSGDVIGQCISSLREAIINSGILCKIIIVDNGSHDDTVEKARKIYPESWIIENNSNYGYSKAINQAVLGCKTNWFLFLNPDTIVGKDLFTFLKHADHLPNVSVFSPLLVNEDGNVTRTSYKWPVLSKELVRLFGLERVARTFIISVNNPLPFIREVEFPEPIGEVKVVDYVAGAALFIRGEAWRKIGPFDENFFLYHEEMEWCYRASKYNIPVFVFMRFKVLHYSKRSSKKRPREVILWKYKGLLYFYGKYRPIVFVVSLKIALIISFTLRSILVLLKGDIDRAKVFISIVKISLSKGAL